MAGQGIERREMLRMLAMAAAAGQFPGFHRWTFACGHHGEGDVIAGAPAARYTPQFFSADEYATLDQLTELILPSDDDSGRARSRRQRVRRLHGRAAIRRSSTDFRYGLTWLDAARAQRAAAYLPRARARGPDGAARAARLPRAGSEGSRTRRRGRPRLLQAAARLHPDGLLHVAASASSSSTTRGCAALHRVAGLSASGRPGTPASAGAEGLRPPGRHDLRRDRDRHRRGRRHGHQDAVRGGPVGVRAQLRPAARSGQGLPQPQAALRHAVPRVRRSEEARRATTTSRTNTRDGRVGARHHLHDRAGHELGMAALPRRRRQDELLGPLRRPHGRHRLQDGEPRRRLRRGLARRLRRRSRRTTAASSA